MGKPPDIVNITFFANDTLGHTISKNFTIEEYTRVINQDLWETLSNGQIRLRFYANDTLENNTFKDVILIKDYKPPAHLIIYENFIFSFFRVFLFIIN
jgi:hypothetical protein